MSVFSIYFRVIILMVWAIVSFYQSAFAQQSPPIVTEFPKDYVVNFLDKLEENGMEASEELFEDFGMLTPQNAGTIAAYKSVEGDKEERWSKVIGTKTTEDVHMQAYAYAYIGKNGWIYWRFDFSRISDEKWALTNVIFHSEYDQILAREWGNFD